MAASPSTLVPSIPHALASIHAPASITLQRSFKCPCCSVFPHSTHPAFLSAFPSSLPPYYGGISLHIRSIHSSRFSVHSRCSVKIIPFVFFYNTIFHKKKCFVIKITKQIIPHCEASFSYTSTALSFSAKKLSRLFIA